MHDKKIDYIRSFYIGNQVVLQLEKYCEYKDMF